MLNLKSLQENLLQSVTKALREKCPNAGISVRIQENTDQKKLRI